MSIFGIIRSKKLKKDHHESQGAAPPGKTAPGVRAIKELWNIESRKPITRIEGEVVTDIYATQRPNGVPRRRHARTEPLEPSEFTPPY